MAEFKNEFRGATDLVYAEVLRDDNEIDGGYVTGPVKILAPVAQIEKTTENSSDTHYYDNKPMITINAQGADTLTLTVAALDLATLAEITGKDYDPQTGAFMDGERTQKYFALGYKIGFVGDQGGDRLVWKYKGSFQIPDESSQTINNSTDASGQSLVYTAIETNHVFQKTGKSGLGLYVDEWRNLANLNSFFDQVTTCDTLQPKVAYSLGMAEGANTTLFVRRGTESLHDESVIYAGDVLTVGAYVSPVANGWYEEFHGDYFLSEDTVMRSDNRYYTKSGSDYTLVTIEGCTLTVNGVATASGSTYTVTGNTEVASTAVSGT